MSNDSHGNHRAWPEMWYTDLPVPAPFAHFSSLQSVPKNGFGVRFAGLPANQLACRVNCANEPKGDATTDTSPLTVAVPGVFGIAAARGALLTFTYSTYNR